MAGAHQAEPCPWWLGFVLAHPVRKLFQDPAEVVAPYVGEGMMVLEPGCGMGFFTLELARRVGSSGRVVAVDLQQKMLDGLRRRAKRAGLLDRLDIRRTEVDTLGVADLGGRIDFALAFYVVHELPNPSGFFQEVHDSLRSKGRLLIVEPRDHGGGEDGLEGSLQLAAQAGLVVVDRPVIKRNQVVLLERPAGS